MNKINFYMKLVLILLSLCLGRETWANCEQQPTSGEKITETEDNAAAKISAGNIQLLNTSIQPVGTVLASVSVAPTEYKVNAAGPDTILWICGQGDKNKISFLVATNGDDRVGGFFKADPSTQAGGQDGVYYTWFQQVGLRLTLSGVVLSRNWQAVPVAYDSDTTLIPACSSNKICIRLKHIPIMQAELIKVSGTPSSSGAGSNYCSGLTTGSVSGMGDSGNYNCGQPAAYIQLSNIGSNTEVTFGHDAAGADSNTNYNFYAADNGFGYTLYNASRLLSESNSCSATAANNTQTVTFPLASATALNSGGNVSTIFNIKIDCTGGVTAGTASNQFAVGIQASPAAYNQAQTLGLVNSSQGVDALVSDDYSSNLARARNVGIFLQDGSTSADMKFVGQPGMAGGFPNTTNIGGGGANYICTWTGNTNPANTCYLGSSSPSGNNAGWYTYSALTQTTGTKTTTIPLKAVLKKLPSAGAVTPGSVNATAYVLVKMQ